MALRRPVNLISALGVAAAFAGAAAAARGETGAPPGAAWHRNERVAVRLVAAETGTGGRDTLWFALEFRLAPGWKTYWRSPGESGIPAAFDWAGSENLAPAPHWPAPVRFAIAGVESIGYGGRVVVPVSARVLAPGAARLKLHLRFAVCREVCVPEEARFELALPARPARRSALAALVSSARAALPANGAKFGWRVVAHEKSAKTVRVVVESAGAPFRAPDLFCEGAVGDQFGRPSVTLTEGGRRAVFEVPIQAWAASGERRYRLTLVDGARAAEFPAAPGL